MRVIAGSARRIQLKTVDTVDTRPTTDRIKETLFNMIQFDVPGTSVLDLFAGSGSLGIEALSRGARHAVFSDLRKEAVQCIEENLQKTHLSPQAEVMLGDYRTVLRRLQGRGQHFDLVFLDPPYGKEMSQQALSLLWEMDYVDEGTLFILEAALAEDFSELEDSYQLIREKRYKTNKHLFLKKR